MCGNSVIKAEDTFVLAFRLISIYAQKDNPRCNFDVIGIVIYNENVSIRFSSSDNEWYFNGIDTFPHSRLFRNNTHKHYVSYVLCYCR